MIVKQLQTIKSLEKEMQTLKLVRDARPDVKKMYNY